jgi:hypothetical protein
VASYGWWRSDNRFVVTACTARKYLDRLIHITNFSIQENQLVAKGVLNRIVTRDGTPTTIIQNVAAR